MKKISIAWYSRIILYFSLIISLANIFTSCKKENVASDNNTASNSLVSDKTESANSAATVTDDHFDYPGPFISYIPCTGEDVIITGNFGVEIHTVINGNNINYSEHLQGHLEGKGSFGNTYANNINGHLATSQSTSNELFIIESSYIFRLISKGGAPDLIVKRIGHLTINANGVITSNNSQYTIICP